jgi:hypothetical protein
MVIVGIDRVSPGFEVVIEQEGEYEGGAEGWNFLVPLLVNGMKYASRLFGHRWGQKISIKQLNRTATNDNFKAYE